VLYPASRYARSRSVRLVMRMGSTTLTFHGSAQERRLDIDTSADLHIMAYEPA